MSTLFDFKMRLLGYYNFPNQTMKPEEAYVKEAEELAPLLRASLESIRNNSNADDFIKEVISGKAVFIFKDERNKLYAYFTGTEIARITNVAYSKKNIKQVPLKYKRWFVPGHDIILIEDHVRENPKEVPSVEIDEKHNNTSNPEGDNSFDWTNFI